MSKEKKIDNSDNWAKQVQINIAHKSKRVIQCPTCLGIGLLKYTPVICSVCDGIKCMQCNSTGLSVMPYEECFVCYGYGEIPNTFNTIQP